MKVAEGRVNEATRTQERLIPRILGLAAATPAGTLAKARVVLDLFGNSPGRRSRPVRLLLADLEAVLGVPGTGADGR